VCFIYSKTRHGLKYGPFWWPGAHKNPHKILKNVINFMKFGKTHLLLLYSRNITIGLFKTDFGMFVGPNFWKHCENCVFFAKIAKSQFLGRHQLKNRVFLIFSFETLCLPQSASKKCRLRKIWEKSPVLPTSNIK